jgi:hypothetical protein
MDFQTAALMASGISLFVIPTLRTTTVWCLERRIQYGVPAEDRSSSRSRPELFVPRPESTPDAESPLPGDAPRRDVESDSELRKKPLSPLIPR